MHKLRLHLNPPPFSLTSSDERENNNDAYVICLSFNLQEMLAIVFYYVLLGGMLLLAGCSV
jgi:hypothetical protein